MNNSVYSISKKQFCPYVYILPKQLISILKKSQSKPLIAQKHLSQMKRKKHSYWNRLIHGNIDRTHEKRSDISFVSSDFICC